ncbi:glycosyltransferase family 2 protein [Pseudomonas putida]|nr:glycosyltransferase family 2 protein [Pseudomonas putida]
MIGVIIPVHNEQASLDRCLQSVMQAAEHGTLCTELVRIVVVLDDCSDQSRDIAQRYPVRLIDITAGNPLAARAVGADHLVHAGARWLALTEADVRVPDDWLAAQLAYQVDAVCGRVDAEPGARKGVPGQRRRRSIALDELRPGVHGANLGISTVAYLDAGGLSAVTGQDEVQLIRRVEANGRRIAWSGSVRVRRCAVVGSGYGEPARLPALSRASGF